MDPVSIILTTLGWLISAIISKTISEGWECYTKRKKLDEKIQSLITEFGNINMLLEGAQSVQLPSNRVHLHKYLKEVKNLAYESWDIFDDLDYFRLQKEVQRMNHAEQSELGSIVPAIQHATDQILYTNRPQTTSYTQETHVYGRDMEINQILELVENGKSQTGRLPVIAIVGNGGVGKTTLAQEIHNHKKIENQFDLRIWICVSTEFDDMRITRQMLEHCSDDGKGYDGENLNNMKRILTSRLKGKRVLLIFDDIWAIESDKEWNSLLAPLNPNITTMIGSTVVVTTRDASIAKRVKTIDPVIQLDGLLESSFCALFKKLVFGDDQYRVPWELENISKEILKKLKGYPLAAKTVGAPLKGNTDVIHWLKILESEQWKFQQDDDGIMPALRLSYEYLPVHLQLCFSYCSLFPKDYKFKAEELVYMWMAQDYICTNDKRVEDVGLDYLKKLVDKAFFQEYVGKWDSVDCTWYVIHDLLHDLAQTVSEEEFLAINHPTNNGKPLNFNCRHLSFLVDVEPTIESCVQYENLCSLVIFINKKAPKDTLTWDQANRVRHHLLILPYKCSISYNFSYFTHLRYLKIKNCYSNRREFNGYEKVEIPVQICRLYHLQVLELECPRNCRKLPKEFNNLVNLRHFIAHAKLHSRIAGVSRLEQLQELRKFVVRKEKGFELHQLSELKELRGYLDICGLQNVKGREEAERARLSEKKIVYLKLDWDLNTPKPWKNKEVMRECSEFKGWRVQRCRYGREIRECRECRERKTTNAFYVERLELLEAHWPSNESKESREFEVPRAMLCGEGIDDRECKECRDRGTTNALSVEILEALRPNSELRDLYIVNYGGCNSPSWLTNHSIKYLRSIRLINCEAWEELPYFGQLMCLKELYLIGLPKVKAFLPQFQGAAHGKAFHL